MSNEESQFNLQGYNIVTLLKRLEAATSRLEDVVVFQGETAKQIRGDTPGEAKDNAKALAKATATESNKSIASSAPEETSKSVKAYEDLIQTGVNPFVELSKELDAVIFEAAELFKEALTSQIQLISAASKSKKPDFSDPALVEVVSPINEKITKLGELKEKNRKSQFFNHLNTIAEGAAVVGWVFSETPVSFIPEFKDSSQFWSNRVVKEYKDKDDRHTKWVHAFFQIFDDLKGYAKEFHTTGLAWNANGGSLSDVAKKSVGSSGPVAGGSNPPPPPPPPPPASIFESKPTTSETGGISAVFADLNKGEEITASLKKVDKSQMTHKNPELRKDSIVSAKKPAPPKKPSNLSTSATAAPKKKPAKKELIDGSKWMIENYTEADTNGAPIIIEAEMYQSIYIGKCSGITIQIRGKANAVSISETRNVGVIFDSLVSGVDVIKSYRFAVQVTDLVPMVSIDKSDEGTLYLSQKSIDSDIQVYTSCTTALNILVPSGDEYTELPAPEQLKHSVKNGKLVTEIVEHAG